MAVLLIAKITIFKLACSKFIISNKYFAYYGSIVSFILKVKCKSHESKVESLNNCMLSSELFDFAIIGPKVSVKEGWKSESIMIDRRDLIR